MGGDAITDRLLEQTNKLTTEIVEVYQCSIPERSIQDKPISQEKLIHVLQLGKCTPGKNVLLEKCSPQKNVPAGSLLWTEKNH